MFECNLIFKQSFFKVIMAEDLTEKLTEEVLKVLDEAKDRVFYTKIIASINNGVNPEWTSPQLLYFDKKRYDIMGVLNQLEKESKVTRYKDGYYELSKVNQPLNS